MLLRCRIPLAHFELDVDVAFDARVASIFGPSGSGKTTLLDAIAGLRNITTGEIEINGSTLFSSARGINRPPRERGIGYVPQEGALFPHLSVRKNILFGASRDAYGKSSKSISVEHVLDVLEIGNLLDRPVTKLSGGEAQRVALARAILSQPQLLLLDEPLASLDISLKEKILPYLARVRDEFEIPMIYVTHSLTEVLTLADWVLMIQQGRVGDPGRSQGGAQVHPMRSCKFPRSSSKTSLPSLLSSRIPKPVEPKCVCKPGRSFSFPISRDQEADTIQIRISADDILVAYQTA